MDIYLHCQDPAINADKVYSINLRQTTAGRWAVLGWNGRWGNTMVPQFKIFRTLREAEKDVQKRLRDKESKGYQHVTANTVWPNGNILIDQTLVDDKFIENIQEKRITTNWPSGSATPNIPMPANTKVKTPKSKQKAQPRAANLPAIPAWILACFHEIPEPTHDRAVLILSGAFPADAPMIALGAKHPEEQPVDWMRAIFARLPIDARKNVYRRFTIVLHPDQGGDELSFQKWNETYNRFAA